MGRMILSSTIDCLLGLHSLASLGSVSVTTDPPTASQQERGNDTQNGCTYCVFALNLIFEFDPCYAQKLR